MGKMAYILAPNAFKSCFFVINSCNPRYYNIKNLENWNNLKILENRSKFESILVKNV